MNKGAPKGDGGGGSGVSQQNFYNITSAILQDSILLDEKIIMRGSVQTTFSQTLALFSVIFFIISTIIICLCAYCCDFKKICCSLFFFLKPSTEETSLSGRHNKYKDYQQASQHDIFLNDHFTTETPLPSDEMTMPWRNAVIMGTPPYRKFTTISSNFQGDFGNQNYDLSRQGSDKRDCVISAV